MSSNSSKSLPKVYRDLGYKDAEAAPDKEQLEGIIIANKAFAAYRKIKDRTAINRLIMAVIVFSACVSSVLAYLGLEHAITEDKPVFAFVSAVPNMLAAIMLYLNKRSADYLFEPEENEQE